MTASTRTSEQLLAELIAGAVRPYAGAVGVIVRDVLSPDPKTLLERLKAMHDEEAFPDLRVAYLRPGGEEAAKEVGVDGDVFSTEIEQAERWRNERDLEALIVVVARGDEAKLSSLEDFGTVTSQDLKSALVERAMGGPAGENDVQTLLWQMLSSDDAVGLGQLVDYYLSLEGKDGADFKTRVLARVAPARAVARSHPLRQPQSSGDAEAPAVEPRDRRAPADADAEGPPHDQAGRRGRDRSR